MKNRKAIQKMQKGSLKTLLYMNWHMQLIECILGVSTINNGNIFVN